MLVATLLSIAYQVASPCVPMGTEPKYEAVAGNYKVVPVREALQTRFLRRLKGRGLVALTQGDALVAAGDNSLVGRHFYLARAGYVAEPRATGVVPTGLQLSVDVDSKGVAYVTSYILSRQQGAAAIAVLVSSERPIKRVVAVCGAAE
jgi:hypothetical protein